MDRSRVLKCWRALQGVPTSQRLPCVTSGRLQIQPAQKPSPPSLRSARLWWNNEAVAAGLPAAAAAAAGVSEGQGASINKPLSGAANIKSRA